MPQPKAQPVCSPKHIADLRSAFRGSVIAEADAGYDSARAVINGMIDRRPVVVARCAGVSDVKRALDFGVERSLPIAIRSGGHSVPGFGVCNGGIVIDLSSMSAVDVDPENRSARCQSGTNWGQFDLETQAFGLATTGGLVRTTGVSGLTLAGGHGFLVRRFGLSCDNLISADVLTANGSLVKASATQNADLFWAIRGGGGNFGVVTSMEFRVHPVAPVFGGVRITPFSEAHTVLRTYDQFTAGAPDELGTLAALATLPDGTKAVIHLACWSGDMDAAESVLRPLRSGPAPIADQMQPMPYTAIQSIVENFNPPGKRNYWKTIYTNDLPDEAIEVMTDAYARVPAPLTHIVCYTLGGAVARVGEDETAVSNRNVRHAIIAIGMWDRPEDDDVNIAWVRDFADRMAPFAVGGFYPNYDADADSNRVAVAFGPSKYQRLAAIKRKYDPDNVFRLNQNIRPVQA